MTGGYSAATHSTSGDSNHQNQNQNHRYEWLKRQYQAQRGELIVYKRELIHLRTTQKRQKDKLADMERRLNEHEQNFIDVLAQLRSNGSISAISNTGNVEVVIDEEDDQSVTTLSRKRVNDDRSTATVAKRKKITGADGAYEKKIFFL